MELTKRIGLRLREARKAQGLSLAALAARTSSLSKSRISNYEQGLRRMGLEEARELASALGTVSATYLLCLEDEGYVTKRESALLDYYRQADPEKFHEHWLQALKTYESGRAKLSDDDAQTLRKLKLYSEKNAQQALEKARKALDALSDKELGERTARALDYTDALRAYSDRLETRYGEENVKEWTQSSGIDAERAKIEVLKSELEATRQQLEAQRKQIEELKRALERLTRQRNPDRLLR